MKLDMPNYSKNSELDSQSKKLTLHFRNAKYDIAPLHLVFKCAKSIEILLSLSFTDLIGCDVIT